jgi:hypothetical protein
MNILPIVLFGLGLGVMATSASNVNIADGSCVTIRIGDMIMYERTASENWPSYVYMGKSDKYKEYDKQRWFLYSTKDGYFKLKNKHSNRYLVIGTWDYLLTAGDAVRAMDHFKFERKPDGKYDIYNKVKQRPYSRGLEWCLKWTRSSQQFTVQHCKLER